MDLWRVKVVLLKHKAVPMLMIRVTVNRKVCYLKTPFLVTESQLDGERVVNHPNKNKINITLSKEKAKIEEQLMNLHLAGKEITPRLLKNIIRGKAGSKNVDDFVRSLMTDKNRIIYTKELRRLNTFAPGISLSDIDTQFVRSYEEHERKRGMSQNTLNTTFKWLRRVLNQAAEEGHIKENPVRKVPKYVQSERIFLSKDERRLLFDYWKEKKVDGALYISLTYFLLGVYSGLRYSDWKNVLKRVQGKFLRLQAMKNKEWVVLPIGPSLKKILTELKDMPPPYSADKTRVHLKIIAGQLSMKKNITTHSARHTFGAMCAEMEIAKSSAAALMGITVDTVDTYYHLTGKNIIEQAKVLGRV